MISSSSILLNYRSKHQPYSPLGQVVIVIYLVGKTMMSTKQCCDWHAWMWILMKVSNAEIGRMKSIIRDVKPLTTQDKLNTVNYLTHWYSIII